jgi:hypothetical protein
LTYLFISKVLEKRAASMETNDHSRAFFNISFRVPSKGALPPGPPHGVPLDRDALFLEPSFIHHSKFPVYVPPPPRFELRLSCKGAPMERDARIRSPS